MDKCSLYSFALTLHVLTIRSIVQVLIGCASGSAFQCSHRPANALEHAVPAEFVSPGVACHGQTKHRQGGCAHSCI
jgi:hypothetical protein